MGSIGTSAERRKEVGHGEITIAHLLNCEYGRNGCGIEELLELILFPVGIPGVHINLMLTCPLDEIVE